MTAKTILCLVAAASLSAIGGFALGQLGSNDLREGADKELVSDDSREGVDEELAKLRSQVGELETELKQVLDLLSHSNRGIPFDEVDELVNLIHQVEKDWKSGQANESRAFRDLKGRVAKASIPGI